MPDDTAVSGAKMAELIEMPFGLCTRLGPRKHVLGGVVKTIEPSICGGDTTCFQITLTTCCYYYYPYRNTEYCYRRPSKLSVGLTV